MEFEGYIIKWNGSDWDRGGLQPRVTTPDGFVWVGSPINREFVTDEIRNVVKQKAVEKGYKHLVIKKYYENNKNDS